MVMILHFTNRRIQRIRCYKLHVTFFFACAAIVSSELIWEKKQWTSRLNGSIDNPLRFQMSTQRNGNVSKSPIWPKSSNQLGNCNYQRLRSYAAQLYSPICDSSTTAFARARHPLSTTRIAGTSTFSLVSTTHLPHVYHVARQALLQSFAELLMYWECTEILVTVDSHTGLGANDIQHFLEVRGIRVSVLVMDGSESSDESDLEQISSVINGGGHRYVALLSGASNNARVLRQCATSVQSLAVQRTWLLFGRKDTPRLSRVEEVASRPCAEAPPCQLNVLAVEQESSHAERVFIYDVYLPPLSSSLQWQAFALWRLPTGVRYLSLREANLTGAMLRRRIIRTTTIQFAPYIFLNNNHTSVTGGYIIELLDAMAKFLNVEFRLKLPIDTAFGMDVNGTFTGLIGTVQTGEADMTQSLVAMTTARARVIRYTSTVCFAYLTMAIPRPDSRVPPTIFVLPFSRSVWLALLVVSTGTLAALVVTLIRGGGDGRPDSRLTYWLLAGQFLEEAMQELRGASSRAVMLSLLTTVMVTFTYYCTALTSFLTFREERLPFNNLLEMSKDRDHRVLLVRYSKYHEQFKNAPVGDPYQAVWRKIMKEGGETGLIRRFEEGYALLLTGKYVMISDGPSVHFFDRDACRLAFPEQKFNTEWMYMAARKDFPYHRIVSHTLTRLMENGVMSRLKKLHLQPGRERCRPERSSQTLGFSQLVPLFVFVALGAQLAILALLAELAHARRNCARALD